MAWTQADLDRLDAAIASNVRKVTFADGRSTEYQNAGEMLSVRNTIKAELLAASTRTNERPRATRATMRRS